MPTEKAKDKAREIAGAAEQAYGKTIHSPGTRLRGATRRHAAQASHAVHDAASSVRQQVSHNPLSGVIIAAGIGMIFGYLLGRR